LQLVQEIKEEFAPEAGGRAQLEKHAGTIFNFVKGFTYFPFFPAFHRPGWLLRYIVGPYDWEWFEMFFAGACRNIDLP
jgi:hypothetical protein